MFREAAFTRNVCKRKYTVFSSQHTRNTAGFFVQRPDERKLQHGIKDLLFQSLIIPVLFSQEREISRESDTYTVTIKARFAAWFAVRNCDLFSTKCPNNYMIKCLSSSQNLDTQVLH